MRHTLEQGGLAAGAWAATLGAPAARAADTLPPVMLSSYTLHEGDTISLSGTGCVDPGTGSGAGAMVALLRPVSNGGRGTTSSVVVNIAVSADGSFSGSGFPSPSTRRAPTRPAPPRPVSP